MGAARNPRDIVVRCSSGNHAVRLARGRRFWSAARCPVCRAPVDPHRTRRLLAWLNSLARPLSSWWLHRLVWWGSLGYLALAVLSYGLLWGLSDLWWPATILLFGPRWILLLPLGLLLPVAFFWDRPLLPGLFLAGLIVLGPVMGFRTGWRSLLPSEEQDGDLRVVSFNAGGGVDLTRTPMTMLREWRADVAAFQECAGDLSAALRETPEWYVDIRSGVCFVSRFAITDVTEMEREALESAGGSGVAVTYTLDVNGSPLHVTNVHLETPRAGFELIRGGHLREGIPKIREKSFLRGIELRRARIWADGFTGPQIVLGDFNTPPESRAYRQVWAEWQNAFSLAGRGLGGTRQNGWIRARIDHILANRDLKVMDAWIGEDLGSDHLPIVATLRLR
jgi:vancomycin resistance protein VanJ